MAFYLKYRSQRVEDLDIASVREGLYGVLQSRISGNLPHALLFAGPRGTGKTSSARILAKAVNCVGRGEGLDAENSKLQSSNVKQISNSKIQKLETRNSKLETLEPCNDCEACRTITLGSSLDVIEIDAASHRGIDDIRDLREKVRLAPVSLKYKVYIIDEVHMLTTEAFNALLKTLEEPPKNVVFILCTTEADKLPETIVSRCIQVKFKKASKADIVHSLGRVVQGEGLEVAEGVLELIAEQAGGSFRDAHKMLEQLSWNSPAKQDSGKIELEQVKMQAGMSEKRVEELVGLLGERDVGGCLRVIEEIVAAGENLQQIGEDLVARLHTEWLQKIRQTTDNLQLTTNQKKSSVVSGQLSVVDLMSLIQLLDKAVVEMKQAEIVQLPLEVAIVEWGSGRQTIDNKQLTTNQKEEQETGQRGNTERKIDVEVKSNQVQSVVSGQLSDVSTYKVVTEEKQTLVSDNLAGMVVTLDTVQRKWEELLNTVRPKNHSVQALLRSARPKAVDNNQLIIEVFYPFHLDKLKVETLRRMVEDSVMEVFGWKGVRLQYVLGERVEGQKSRRAEGQRNTISEEEMGVGNTSSKLQMSNNKQSSNFKNQNWGARNGSSKPGVPETTEEDEGLIKFAMEVFGK